VQGARRVVLALGLLSALGIAGSPQQQGAGAFDPARAQALAAAQSSAAQSALIAYLNSIGNAQLEGRAAAIPRITTRAAAERRQAEVRRTIGNLVGGVPHATGPVSLKRFATVEEDGFRVENIAYESLPGYWVTANVFVPQGTGPFPAMVVAPGHGAGKASQFAWGAHFARSGILTLSIDPMGQGERLQHFDPELGASKVEPSGEHEHANQTSLLVGEHIARYWFADGVRGVDYLSERKDVDAARIGTFGCSGGGTAAAYLAAMDPRIHVAAVASFITSFHALLPGNGPQDAEQTLPRFLAAGLDFADWVELAAPRPLAIVAFETDFFPIAGAQSTYDEARRFYALEGAADNLQLIRGQGGHCDLGPVMPEVLGFLTKHLKGADVPVAPFRASRPRDIDALTVTPTGQVSTSLGGVTVEDMARREGPAPAAAAPATREEILALRTRVRSEVRALNAIVAVPGAAAKATAAPRETRDGYRTETVTVESEPGITLNGILALPDGPGLYPAIVWMDAAPLDTTAANPELTRLAKSGRVVLALHPRGVLGEPPPNPNPLALGPYMPLLLRAIVVGKTLVGMRVDDTLRTVDWLTSRPEVDRSSLTLYATGSLGMVALHAAALDERITHVVVERTLVSYRMALEAGLHKNLSEVLIPNVLKHYDVGDLLMAMHPRPVALVNPATPMGQVARQSVVRELLAVAFDADRSLGTPNRVRIARRDWWDPIPIE